MLLPWCGQLVGAVLRLRPLRRLVCSWELLRRWQTWVRLRLRGRPAVRRSSDCGALALERGPFQQTFQPLVPAAAAGSGPRRCQLCLQLPCRQPRRPRRRRLSILFVRLHISK